MRSHRPRRLLTLAALLLAGVLSNAGCTYYTVYSQPRGTVHTGTVASANLGALGNCCQTECTTCGVLSNGLVGYEIYESQNLELVQYVHVLQPAIDTYPVVLWGGRSYYNIEGSLVYYSSEYAAWVYYWTPPAALIYVWNDRFPAQQYVWADGCYGTSWYWGGVRDDGFHRYATTGYRPWYPPVPPSGRPQVPGAVHV